MKEKGYWISLPYATFGIFSADHIIVSDAAPIAKWSVGKKVSYVLAYYRKKGAIIEEFEETNTT